MPAAQPTKEEMQEQLATLRKDVEILGGMATARAQHAAERGRARVEDSLTELSDEARSLIANAEDRLRDRAGEAEDLVKSNPLTSVAIAFGIGWLIGQVNRR